MSETTKEIAAKMEVLWDTYKTNQTQFEEKGTKAAAARARKALNELKKLVTPFKKVSVQESK